MSTTGSSLQLFVHDYDRVALGERYEDLRKALPAATIHPFSSRSKLLEWIAALPESPRTNWPLALIDLQGDKDVQARGEHLLATINEHPLLRRRVVLVAFTRHGFRRRTRGLRARGAGAVLSPIDLGEIADLEERLGVLSTGAAPFEVIGETNSGEADQRAVDRLAIYFPSLEDPKLTKRERWKRAHDLLVLCRLKYEGWDDAPIARLKGVKDRALDDARKDLLSSPVAEPPLVSTTGRVADLGPVIEKIIPHLQGSEFIYDVIVDRSGLDDAAARLEVVKDRVANRYPLTGSAAEDDDAWIPPACLDALREFIAQFDQLPPAKSHASRETRAERSQRAIKGVATAMMIKPKVAEHYVTHAVMCLEDAEAESSRELSSGDA